ncbi:hypothetical protein NPIL_625511 [Nephila pilipes]|uniref:Uncharacterized protein n=1 Tax=Nephila pilipes TaxID=299642 RepID=A0A8X6PQ73_NEPPI|nr:hypothetical protein NPIL_625511 [Nephila pilipes]
MMGLVIKEANTPDHHGQYPIGQMEPLSCYESPGVMGRATSLIEFCEYQCLIDTVDCQGYGCIKMRFMDGRKTHLMENYSGVMLKKNLGDYK